MAVAVASMLPAVRSVEAVLTAGAVHEASVVGPFGGRVRRTDGFAFTALPSVAKPRDGKAWVGL